MKHILVLLLSVISFLPADPVLAERHDQVSKRLVAVTESYAADRRFMGTVLVAQGDRVLLNQGFGQADLQWNTPNTPEVRFRLGSVSKQFTAALILLLEQQGKLSIDDPVHKYLQNVPAAWDHVTISELLDHSSGIADLTHDATFPAWQMAPHSRPEVMTFLAAKPLEFVPGSKAEYSNSNYIVLGAIVETVSRESFSDALKHYIFVPLGMHDSGLDTDEAVVSRHAEGYKLNESRTLVSARAGSMTVPWSAGSIYSTTGDLLRWEQALFSGRILSPEEFSKMTTARIGGFGLGVEVHRNEGLTEIDHSGSIEGFNTHMLYIPEHKITVIVLGNVNGRTVDILTNQLRDVALGREVVLQQERRTVPISPEALQQFRGVYHVVSGEDRSFDLTMLVTPRGLAAQGDDQKPLDLLYQGTRNDHPRFYQPDLDAELEFVPDATGLAGKLLLHQNGSIAGGVRQ